LGERLLKEVKEHSLEISHSITLLTPSEVAKLFKVDPKTVTRWSNNGKITCIRTVGGHRRYRLEEVQKLLNGSQSVAI